MRGSAKIQLCVEQNLFSRFFQRQGRMSSPAVGASPSAAVEDSVDGFSVEEEAVLQWVLEEKERKPTKVCVLHKASLLYVLFRWKHMHASCSLQLALWVERWDAKEGKRVENPHAEQVRVLWGLEKGKRMQMWRRLGRFQELEELELGGWVVCELPMDVEELLTLLPEGAGTLAGMHQLALWWCGDQVDDEFLRVLASAKLTSLHLEGALAVVFSQFHGVVRIDVTPLLLCCERAGLGHEVTNSGLCNLASAGCGKKLASLHLSREHCVVSNGVVFKSCECDVHPSLFCTSRSARRGDRSRSRRARPCRLWREADVAAS